MGKGRGQHSRERVQKWKWRERMGEGRFAIIRFLTRKLGFGMTAYGSSER
jgi:hypothetical protein